MKNSNLLLALLLATSTLFTGCFIDVNDDDSLFGCFDADGPVITAEVEVEQFDRLELAMEAFVEITQGDDFSVTFEGKSDILDELDLNVRNGRWTIRTVDCVRDVDDLTFYITVPHLDQIRVTGSGEVRSTNTFVGEDVELTITGSGEIDVAIECDDVEANISGSGKIFTEGLANELDVEVTGSGDFRGFNLEAQEVNVRVSGSGEAEVLAVERLDVRITGSGDVYYKGQPLIDVSITGSGDLIDAN